MSKNDFRDDVHPLLSPAQPQHDIALKLLDGSGAWSRQPFNLPQAAVPETSERRATSTQSQCARTFPEFDWRDATYQSLFTGALAGCLTAALRIKGPGASAAFGVSVALGTYIAKLGRYEWNKYA